MPSVEPAKFAEANAYTVRSCVVAAPAAGTPAVSVTATRPVATSAAVVSAAAMARPNAREELAISRRLVGSRRRFRVATDIVSRMFRPVDTALDLVALEESVLARWREDDVFGESLRRRAAAPEWVFYEGPPTANNRPGIHHVWARIFKDIYPRFQTMRGKHVARKGGWDCHGLPVEVEVEKQLGFSGKNEIEDYGIERFNAMCRASVQRYVEDWQSLTSRIGMWIDTAGAYWTMHNEFMETVWWL